MKLYKKNLMKKARKKSEKFFIRLFACSDKLSNFFHYVNLACSVVYKSHVRLSGHYVQKSGRKEESR